MIASLSGQVQMREEGALVIAVEGVGYRVHVTASVIDSVPHVGMHIELITELIVRENELALYGFGSAEERDLFRSLLTVSGVGPRTALAVLSTFSPETLRGAVAHDDVAALTRIPGIGRKTAQRLVLDLRDRIGVPTQAWQPTSVSQGDVDVLNALTALGYSQAEAQAALAAIPSDAETLDARILAALRSLGG
ncbi:MAG: Holliday junction branch migration protein RuvA [Chloroflexi bacterium]|jgi:Holliday junction DNA helicase RuvA|nr:Holliday junction branch migration protein RuvA [Chloroflexota bacterium]